MHIQWPDLMLVPINLWSAPWVGWSYQAFERAGPVTVNREFAENQECRRIQELLDLRNKSSMT